MKPTFYYEFNILRPSILLTVTFCLCHFLSFQAGAADWPMYMKDAEHYSQSEESISLPLKLKWRFKTDGPIYSSPVVSGKMAFWGSYDSYLYALDADSGTLIWKIKTDGPILSTPAVSDGVVYFGSKDGKLIWRSKQVDYKYGGMYSSPIYSGGVVYITSKSGITNALDAKSGVRVWVHRTGSSIYSSPVIHKGTFLLATYNRNLLALDAGKGTYIWQTELGEWPYSSPVVVKDRVYTGLKTGSIKSFNIKDGKLEKEYKFPDEVNSTMAVSKNNIALVSRYRGASAALNPATDAVLLQYMTNGGIHSSPAIASNGMVFVGSKDGFAYAFGK